MIKHDSHWFNEKLRELHELNQSGVELAKLYDDVNDEIIQHGQICGECLVAQLQTGLLPEMPHPMLVIGATSSEEYFNAIKN